MIVLLFSFLFSFESNANCFPACTTGYKVIQKQMQLKDKKSNPFAACKSNGKDCKNNCDTNKVGKKGGPLSKTKDGITTSTESQIQNTKAGLAVTKAADKKCKGDRKKTDEKCGEAVKNLQTTLKSCRAGGAACKMQLAQLEKIEKEMNGEKKACGAAAAPFGDKMGKSMADMMKMLGQLAPLLAAMKKDPKDKAAENKITCEEKLEKMGEKDMRCPGKESTCCEQFPCARGCGKMEIVQGESEEEKKVGADLRTPGSELGTASAGLAADLKKKEPTSVADAESAPIDSAALEAICAEDPGSDACTYEGHLNAAGLPSGGAAKANLLEEKNSENSGISDPETSGGKLKKASVPAPTFDNVSTSWGGSSSYGDDGETGGYDPDSGGRASGFSPASKAKQIAPKAGKSPFELITGAYERVRKKGMLINQ